jgi:GDP-4-dehydro-6-deoxy-D-mannose reductase
MQPERILVTGAAGFIGRHALALLAEMYPAAAVFGVDRAAVVLPGVTSLACDLACEGDVRRVVIESRPDWVFHLAGVVRSDDWSELLGAHVDITIHLFEALLAAGHRPRVVVISSAAEYGAVPPDQLPIREDRPPCPVTRYGASKAAQTAVALSYVALGCDLVVARAFNIVGPGMSERLSLGSFAAQITRIESGQQAPLLSVGNLAARRDYLDVRDVAGALVLLAQYGQAGQIYNVCRGQSVAMSDLVDRLVRLAHVPVSVVLDPARQFAVDVPDSYGDCRKLTATTGWTPRISLDDSLADILNACRVQQKVHPT